VRKNAVRRCTLALAVPQLPRTYLFVPGHRPDRFGKALATGADRVILDLEDAVPADAKDDARRAITSFLAPDTAVAVRINGDGTRWFTDDLACVARPGVAAVLVPKVERLDTLDRVAAALAPDTAILPMIETAAGLDRARELAGHPRVQRLVFGSLDFQADLGIPGDDDALLCFRSQIVLTSRLAGIAAPVDGVTPRFDAPEPVTLDAARAKRLGFGGKLCIHPKQVAWVRACFAPTDDEVAWARRVLESTHDGDGAAVVDGAMVDRPVLDRARTILESLDPAGGQPPEG
jgi:citrate lyase subunit beta/citryl-CoA lyase